MLQKLSFGVSIHINQPFRVSHPDTALPVFYRQAEYKDRTGNPVYEMIQDKRVLLVIPVQAVAGTDP